MDLTPPRTALVTAAEFGRMLAIDSHGAEKVMLAGLAGDIFEVATTRGPLRYVTAAGARAVAERAFVDRETAPAAFVVNVGPAVAADEGRWRGWNPNADATANAGGVAGGWRITTVDRFTGCALVATVAGVVAGVYLIRGADIDHGYARFHLDPPTPEAADAYAGRRLPSRRGPVYYAYP